MKSTLPSFFRLAIRAAKFSEHKKYRLAAVLFISGKPCSIGFNHYRTHRLIGSLAPLKTTHAEIDALTGMKHNWDMDKAFLVVARLKKDGTLGMSKPCPICTKILKEKGIKTVYYTTHDGFAREIFV